MHRCFLVLALVLLPAAVCLAEDKPQKAGAKRVKPITIQFQDEDLKQVINSIATFAGANIIVSPKVVGTVTVQLTDVPWTTALRNIVEPLGYRMVEEVHGIFRIIPAADAVGSGSPLPPLPVKPTTGLERYEEFLRDAQTETAAKYFLGRINDLRARGK